MKQRILEKSAISGVLAAFVVVFLLSGIGAVSAQTHQVSTTASTSTGAVALPLHGSGSALVGTSTTPTPVTFDGTMTVQRFTSLGQSVWAVGTISGTVKNASGTVLATVTNLARTLPVQRIDPSCPILALTLGPLHLDLLGLVVDLNQVVLTITAVSGAGNLLGNLLCAVANLLNGAASGNAVATLLNRILAILSGLGV